MKDILMELYYGNYSVSGQKISKESLYGKALHRAVDLEDELMAGLSERQKECFKRYLDAEVRMTDEACRIHFIEGYRLGARMMMSVFSDVSDE